jgi:hypothetical protein
MDLTFARAQTVTPKPAAVAPAHSRPVDARSVDGSTARQRPLFARPLQAKLAINTPGDEYEQEADRISERVMRMPEPQVQRACDGDAGCAQRQPGDDGRLQMRTTGPGSLAGSEASSAVHEVLRSPGQPLDPGTRAFMETRFGHDFSQVRVHADTAAALSAREINAQAYTVGRDIVFGSGRFLPGMSEGRQLLAHELAHVIQQSGGATGSALLQVQRKCYTSNPGAPAPACAPSQEGVGGWQFRFSTRCDDLLPGEEANIEKIRPGYSIEIHGYASRVTERDFPDELACLRANRIADLARAKRADCPIVGIFSHGASPVSVPNKASDPNPPEFWQDVIVRPIAPAPVPGEMWLDPNKIISEGWALYKRAQHDPTTANLDAIAARRAPLRTWIEGISKAAAPQGAELNKVNLDEYRDYYASAEKLWQSIDQLLALQKHPAANQDTYVAWVGGTGPNQGSRLHIQSIPQGARYHIDIFGEGYFPGAINIGIGGFGSLAGRRTTTGVQGTPIPNLIYRRFSGQDANHIPIADHVADLVTEESGPIGFPGLAQEIARIIAPGGTIILYNPENQEQYHDAVAKATGGTITKTKDRGTIESRIVVPGP